MKTSKTVLAGITALVIGTSALAEDTVVNTNSCIGCHGIDWSKSALGKSKVVANMSKEDIKTALMGYKDGSYGGPMKGVMKGQVARYSNEELVSMTDQIVEAVGTVGTENK
jgi:cytochrome c